MTARQALSIIEMAGFVDKGSSGHSAAARCDSAESRAKGQIHVSDSDLQVRRVRHAEIVCEPLGDVVREKWQPGGIAEMG